METQPAQITKHVLTQVNEFQEIKVPGIADGKTNRRFYITRRFGISDVLGI